MENSLNVDPKTHKRKYLVTVIKRINLSDI